LRLAAAVLTGALGLPRLPISSAEAAEELPPFVKPRAAWGAAPPAQPYVPHTPRKVVLHHTGAPWYGQPPIEEYIRRIQAFHVGPEREWEDVAYHFLIDQQGSVWAGRPPGVRGNPSVYYDAAGLVTICLVGDYDLQLPSEAQLQAASRTAAWLIRRYRLAGDVLSSHRTHAPTTCPGANVSRLIENSSLSHRIQAVLP
jgi:hypothetical protein